MMRHAFRNGIVILRCGPLVGGRYVVALLAVISVAACTEDLVTSEPVRMDGQVAAVPGDAFTDAELEELRLRLESGEREEPVAEGRLTIDEENLLARQIHGCWGVPVDKLEPPDLAVELKVWMNRDGTVRQLEVVDKDGMVKSSSLRALAESAMKAVMKCMPLKLPPDKYDQWQVFVLYFDARHFVQR